MRRDKKKTNLVEQISDPFGSNKRNHQRQTKSDISCCFHQNDSETYCHPHCSTELRGSSYKSILARLSPGLSKPKEELDGHAVN